MSKKKVEKRKYSFFFFKVRLKELRKQIEQTWDKSF